MCEASANFNVQKFVWEYIMFHTEKYLVKS